MINVSRLVKDYGARRAIDNCRSLPSRVKSLGS